MTVTTPHHEPKAALSALALSALGVVYGDIGTSPLYTLKTVLDLSGPNSSPAMLLGLLSLIIWTLIIIVSIKYVVFVMRADNHGEGGILALMSLICKKKKHRPVIIACGLMGAALIYGDGVITPSISVLSAIEGIKVLNPHIASLVLPLAVLILTILFSFQFMGTEKIGWIFGPIMIVFFVVIALLGCRAIILYPKVLYAINPIYGIQYLLHGGKTAFMVLGGVFLAVTGAEALYADMGHIGARAIRIAWYSIVLPSLILNYAGQTAYVLSGQEIGDSIFYRLCPSTLLIPLIILSTIATIIASQAIITGAFSMTRQAILLGWCPRLHITYTSRTGYGQIYIRTINWLLMAVTVGITIYFASSDRLAAAYGIAVSMTMMLTTLLMAAAMREVWEWSLALTVAAALPFICIDIIFFSANFIKVLEGGWVPLALAGTIYTVMYVWHRGTDAVQKTMHGEIVSPSDFIANISKQGVPRIKGTAVFLAKSTESVPPLILWHVSHNGVLHHNVVALSVRIEPKPVVRLEKRIILEEVAPNYWSLRARYGFTESIHIPNLLDYIKGLGIPISLDHVVYYIGHETVLHSPSGVGLPTWQESLFAFMQRNAAEIGDYFHLPPEDVLEIGRQVEI